MSAGLISLDIHTPGPPQPLPPCSYTFPDARRADDDGVVAFGGDFEAQTVVAAYRAGIFPWPHASAELLWFSPDPRAIIPVGGLHLSRRLARTIRQGRFRVTLDAAFKEVIQACAARTEGTWITRALVEGYHELSRLGWVHSFEVWDEAGELAGGLYGVAVGALFGAESMFYRRGNASKVAMVAMMEHAERIGVTLVDIQMLTPHTASMGAIEIGRDEYLRLLGDALAREVDWRAMTTRSRAR